VAISAARGPVAVVRSSTASWAWPIRPAALRRGPSVKPMAMQSSFFGRRVAGGMDEGAESLEFGAGELPEP